MYLTINNPHDEPVTQLLSTQKESYNFMGNKEKTVHDNVSWLHDTENVTGNVVTSYLGAERTTHSYKIPSKTWKPEPILNC
jgi:hypothetical protein